MAAASTFKGLEIARKLKQELSLRTGLSALTYVEGVSATGVPTLTIGAMSTTNAAAALIWVTSQDWPLAKDIFGNAQIPYGPHTIRVLKEAASTGWTAALINQLTAVCTSLGCELKLYQSTNGGGVIIADIDDSTKLVSTYEPDIFHVATSSQ